MSAKSDVTAYVAFRQLDLGKSEELGIVISSDLESIRTELKGKVKSPQEEDSDKEGRLPSKMAERAWKLYQGLASYYPLVEISGFITTALLKTFFENNLINHAKEHFALIEQVDGNDIFAVSATELA